MSFLSLPVDIVGVMGSELSSKDIKTLRLTCRSLGSGFHDLVLSCISIVVKTTYDGVLVDEGIVDFLQDLADELLNGHRATTVARRLVIERTHTIPQWYHDQFSTVLQPGAFLDFKELTRSQLPSRHSISLSRSVGSIVASFKYLKDLSWTSIPEEALLNSSIVQGLQTSLPNLDKVLVSLDIQDLHRVLDGLVGLRQLIVRELVFDMEGTPRKTSMLHRTIRNVAQTLEILTLRRGKLIGGLEDIIPVRSITYPRLHRLDVKCRDIRYLAPTAPLDSRQPLFPALTTLILNAGFVDGSDLDVARESLGPTIWDLLRISKVQLRELSVIQLTSSRIAEMLQYIESYSDVLEVFSARYDFYDEPLLERLCSKSLLCHMKSIQSIGYLQVGGSEQPGCTDFSFIDKLLQHYLPNLKWVSVSGVSAYELDNLILRTMRTNPQVLKVRVDTTVALLPDISAYLTSRQFDSANGQLDPAPNIVIDSKVWVPNEIEGGLWRYLAM
ncbi:hypothetical protein FA15DRAFT_297451 [Coprinopsis marcescibilis]|uniref:F-box domain-containing protein n=1 Tax=Coprinopsis marcescibilis TaxID=230819 RepID=A0A5C3KD72_COPMA|nr:hypothetical protein FA15DRAFT_297451 [Coprinopsis marcescibilis]